MENTNSQTKQCHRCGETKDITQFRRMHYGYMSVCKECVAKSQSKTWAKKAEEKKSNEQNALKQQRELRLQDFTPRELMEELYRRGYEGELIYTEIHKIDISKL